MSGYFGGKEGAGVYQTIIANMPPHDTYIETHLGGGSIMRLKPPALRSIGIDRDGDALAKFKGPYPVELVQGDALSTIVSFNYAAAGRVLLYVDPPYVLDTRTSAKRYRYEYSDDDHRALLYHLQLIPARVMVSGYPSRLYDDLLHGWRTVEFQAMTRGGVRTEKLWMNYDAGDVHWATFAGKDFRQRQHIKRKAARWRAKFAAMPAGERLAILAALLELQSSEPTMTADSVRNDDAAGGIVRSGAARASDLFD